MSIVKSAVRRRPFAQIAEQGDIVIYVVHHRNQAMIATVIEHHAVHLTIEVESWT